MAPRFERTAAAPGPTVQGVADGGFSVGGQIYRAVLLTPQQAFAWDAPPINNLDCEAIGPILALEPPPEFLILGTGATMMRPPRGFVQELDSFGIGVEVMDSRAAARTWGILRGEERWIAAAIMGL